MKSSESLKSHRANNARPLKGNKNKRNRRGERRGQKWEEKTGDGRGEEGGEREKKKEEREEKRRRNDEKKGARPLSAVSTTKLSVLSNDEKTLHVRAAARIDLCAAERRSVRQRYRLRPRPRHDDDDDDEEDDDDDDDDDNIVVVVGDARLSFGCTGARLSIWEPTLPFLLLSSAAPHPSATAAAAAAPAASLRPNPRSADTSTPFLRIFRLLSFFHSLFMHSLSIYPSFLLSLFCFHRSPISSLSFRALLLFFPILFLFLLSPRYAYSDFKG